MPKIAHRCVILKIKEYFIHKKNILYEEAYIKSLLICNLYKKVNNLSFNYRCRRKCKK